MMLYAHTRKRGLIDKMFALGISISYDRVLQLSTDLANAVSERYKESQVVFPTSFRRGVFTTSAVDNIDHNPSSTTATGSFHGTGVPLFQHPYFDEQGTEMNDVTIRLGSSKCINPLPDFYTHTHTPPPPPPPPVVTPPKNPPACQLQHPLPLQLMDRR